ncbi:phage holin family protein [Burkholderia cenocepacia]|uniref:phage holin family protein n=1 Tax=Burkholderia cenocepacia TaxID=95486 RepID=UPI00158C42FD|nr:phage holin family protein [Burkholderia cenocepacia]
MALLSRLGKWSHAAQFSVACLTDYANLAAIELGLARKRFMRDLILYAMLGLSVMFGLAFVCVAAIVSAANTRYLIEVAWAVAGFWVLASIGALLVVRTRDEHGTFSVLSEELQRDIRTVRESV